MWPSRRVPRLAPVRVFATTDEFDAVYRRFGPMVERTISWLVRGNNRKVRYRGIERVTTTDDPQLTLYDELLRIHGYLRRDLGVCRQLALDVGGGAPVSDVHRELSLLRAQSPLFLLRHSCLRYCRFVHAHHGLEDDWLFPTVRRFAPDLSVVTDRLEADHRRVSELLDAVEAAAGALDDDDDAPHRRRLVEALDELSEHLFEHLAYEEEHLAPVLRQWTFR
jgi:hypothetical protein